VTVTIAEHVASAALYCAATAATREAAKMANRIFDRCRLLERLILLKKIGYQEDGKVEESGLLLVVKECDAVSKRVANSKLLLICSIVG
jgi:hypothetical protein